MPQDLLQPQMLLGPLPQQGPNSRAAEVRGTGPRHPRHEGGTYVTNMGLK